MHASYLFIYYWRNMARKTMRSHTYSGYGVILS